MATPIIQVDHVSKEYQISHSKASGSGLRHVINDALKNPFGLFKRGGEDHSHESFLALNDVSFELEQGQVLGVIGRNGAGKSTLLKILSRITEPTKGRIHLRGRVSSLLEVGTGFHPELTGRENVFLNGAILGMSRAEIKNKFDEIVAFAEVEKFIDTPVKRYSSGMYVRLAFAVAAHLEPEILIVDEVLAVGDSAFQKKCLGKMRDVSTKDGRTVLFVSHHMNSIRKLCSHCLYLEYGKVKAMGVSGVVVGNYEADCTKGISVQDATIICGRNTFQFLGWKVVGAVGDNLHSIENDGKVKLAIKVQINRDIENGTHGFAIWNSENYLIWGNAYYHLRLFKGVFWFEYEFPCLPLKPGIYHFHVTMYDSDGTLLDQWYSSPDIQINTQPLTHPSDEWSGILNTPATLNVSEVK